MKIAIVQVRGTVGLSQKLKTTFKLLKLLKTHSCVLAEANSSTKGMLIALKDYITWGEIDQATFTLLLEKRGKLAGNKNLTEAYLKEKTNMNFDQFSQSILESKKTFKDLPGIKPYFRLKPPTKGFERGGIKLQYSLGGALGYRKDNINDLIRRMI